MLALGLLALGVAVLVAVLSGAIGARRRGRRAAAGARRSRRRPRRAPRVHAAARAAAPRAGRSSRARPRASSASTRAASPAPRRRHIAKRWMEGFYPIYAIAQRRSASTGCCSPRSTCRRRRSRRRRAPTTGSTSRAAAAGRCSSTSPTGPSTTWDLVSNSYLYGRRPAAYDHVAPKHPSIYDDFDSIMAAAHLLSADGAGYALDASRLGRRLRLLRPRRDRHRLRRPGARARDRLVPARLLHQLRRAPGADRSGPRRLRRAGAGGAAAGRRRARPRSRAPRPRAGGAAGTPQAGDLRR